MKIICKQVFNVKTEMVTFGKTSTIAGQDYKLEDLIARFTRGERLNDVHFRPEDIETVDHPSETPDMENPPIFEDMVDMMQFKEEHEARKSEFKERLAKKKKDAQAEEKKDDDPQ